MRDAVAVRAGIAASLARRHDQQVHAEKINAVAPVTRVADAPRVQAVDPGDARRLSPIALCHEQMLVTACATDVPSRSRLCARASWQVGASSLCSYLSR